MKRTMVFLSPHGRCFRHRINVTLVIIIRSVGGEWKTVGSIPQNRPPRRRQVDVPDVGQPMSGTSILRQWKEGMRGYDVEMMEDVPLRSERFFVCVSKNNENCGKRGKSCGVVDFYVTLAPPKLLALGKAK